MTQRAALNKATLEAAQIDIGDVKLAVVFLDRAAAPSDYAALERAAAKAGLDGELVAVWADEHGRTRFVAKPERHAFLQTVGYDQLRAQFNAKLALD